MGSAAYGNHDEAPAGAAPEGKVAPPPPDDREEERRREALTPGEGATAGKPQGEGDEVDPGVG